MKKLLQRVSGGGAFNRTITGLADILGFVKKKGVSEKVIASEAIQPIGILCESTEKVFSLFTSHFSLLTFHFSLFTSHFSLLTFHKITHPYPPLKREGGKPHLLWQRSSSPSA